MLKQRQIEAFNTVGYIRLRGAVPKSHVEEMCDRVWSLMAEQGIQRNDPATWGRDENTHRGLKVVSKEPGGGGAQFTTAHGPTVELRCSLREAQRPEQRLL